MNSFSDVDGSPDPESLARYLRLVSSAAQIRAGKHARDALLGLRPGTQVLDAGCGLGEDARRMARLVAPTGRVVGLDSSASLLARAAAEPDGSGIEWITGDVHELPFADATFDAVRMERTLQHLADVDSVARQLLRVLRPGGVVCLCEPDWDTLALSAIPTSSSYAARAAMLDRVRNPCVGRDLARILLDAGASSVDVGADTVVVRDVSTIVALGDLSGVLTPQDLDIVRAAADDGRFIGVVTLVTALGHT